MDDSVTVSVTASDVEQLKAAGSVGMNTAVSLRDPTANVDVVVEAVPLVTGTGVLMSVVPSLNWMVPAAVAGATVAVSVTGVPWVTEEAGSVVSVVLVAVAAAAVAPLAVDPLAVDPLAVDPLAVDPLAVDPAGALTTKVTGGDIEGLKAVESVGVNTAVSWCDPAANVDMVPEAVPLVTGTGLPMLVVPFLNCTAPTAVSGMTAAVSVTLVPWATGETGDVISVVVVAVGTAVATVTAGVLAGGAALATPLMSNAPPNATVTRKAPAAYRWKKLLVRMMIVTINAPTAAGNETIRNRVEVISPASTTLTSWTSWTMISPSDGQKFKI